MTRLGVIVTDASPLITLAAADALDTLLMPNVPVLIPDMIYTEVTRDLRKLGAAAVIRWIQDNRSQVTIVPTETFAEYQALLAVNPKTKSKGRGERAAIEVLDHEIATTDDLHAILLFEDTDIRRRRFVRLLPDRVTPLSTGDLLAELEAAGRIQSSDAVLDRAAAHGRNVDQQRKPAADEATRSILRGKLARPDPPKTS